MSNVEYTCVEDNCNSRAFAHPMGTLPEPRCPQHGEKMKATVEPTDHFDPVPFRHDQVKFQEQPTSRDAVVDNNNTNDGETVGEVLDRKAKSSSSSGKSASTSASKS